MMGLEIKRTANAGVLLEIDGIRILLDGVCQKLAPYLETPFSVRRELCENFPNVVAFTHDHPDHYDSSFADLYKKTTLRSVIGPESVSVYEAGNGVKLQSVKTRHIGKCDVPHVSFVITGSRCVWFMGDASPLEIRKLKDLPKPDVLIVPYAYAITETAFKNVKTLGAKEIVVLHLPLPENDTNALWSMLWDTVGNDEKLYIPEVCEVLKI